MLPDLSVFALLRPYSTCLFAACTILLFSFAIAFDHCWECVIPKHCLPTPVLSSMSLWCSVLYNWSTAVIADHVCPVRVWISTLLTCLPSFESTRWYIQFLFTKAEDNDIWICADRLYSLVAVKFSGIPSYILKRLFISLYMVSAVVAVIS